MSDFHLPNLGKRLNGSYDSLMRIQHWEGVNKKLVYFGFGVVYNEVLVGYADGRCSEFMSVHCRDRHHIILITHRTLRCWYLQFFP